MTLTHPTDTQTLAASFYRGGKSRPAQLVIEWVGNGRRETVSRHTVANMREARKLAALECAQPWNF